MILGIETSGKRVAVALIRRDGAALARELRDVNRGHAEALFPAIEAVLDRAGAGYGDLQRIGVCTGPGSFAGIRIGIAAARGLALGRGIPAVGVSRLEALATEAAAGRPAVVVVPGVGGAVYAQPFDADGVPEAPAALVCGDAQPDRDRLVIGTGGILADGLPDPAVIARIAAWREPEGRPVPLYLRDAGAALPHEAPPRILDP